MLLLRYLGEYCLLPETTPATKHLFGAFTFWIILLTGKLIEYRLFNQFTRQQ